MTTRAQTRQMPNLGDTVKFHQDGLVMLGRVVGVAFGRSIDVETDAETFLNIDKWELVG